MQRNFIYQITEEFHNCTISAFLKANGYPHAVMVHLKKTPESILLNGRWEYVNTRMENGDLLEIKLIENDSSEKILPVYAPFRIVYEDEDILVIDKPANMPVHPSLNHYENTLANAVCYYFANQGIPYTFRCVNRLDKNTTGLTIVAKHMLSSAILSQDVAVKNIKREYLAIVAGETDDLGTIDAPIGRKDASTIERQIDYEHGERAVTHYRKIGTKNGYTLLSLILETGRTHQIRVHMSSIGHPLIGDFLYHPESSELPRQALHSHKLEFIHPITKEPLKFTAPIPSDMAEFWNNL
ncbi:MAG: RluA family pseudouridine synthase [Lachnospiraceae bacterium]|nr:RluA family pseudouridine synthase [Lachnospiraceae bacterium]